MYLMFVRADQHHASSRPILVGSTIHIEDTLFCLCLTDCGVLTVSHLNHFCCISIVHRPSYFGCISVGELYYKVNKCLPLNYYLGAIAYIKLPHSITHLRSLPKASSF